MVSISPRDLSGIAGSMMMPLRSETSHVDIARGLVNIVWSYEGQRLPDEQNAQENLAQYVPPRCIGSMADEPLDQPVKKTNEIVTNLLTSVPTTVDPNDVRQYCPQGKRFVLKNIVIRGLISPQQNFVRQQIEQRLGCALSYVCLLLSVDGRVFGSQAAPLQLSGDAIFSDVRFTLTLNPCQQVKVQIIPANIPNNIDFFSVILAWGILPESFESPTCEPRQIVGLNQLNINLNSDLGLFGSTLSLDTISLSPKVFFSRLSLIYSSIKNIRNVPPGHSVQLQTTVEGSLNNNVATSPVYPISNLYGSSDVVLNFSQDNFVIPFVKLNVRIEVIVIPTQTGVIHQAQNPPFLLGSAVVPISSPQGNQPVNIMGQAGGAVVEIKWTTSPPEVGQLPGTSQAQPSLVIANECFGVESNGKRIIGSPRFMSVPSGSRTAAVEVLCVSLLGSPSNTTPTPQAVSVRVVDPNTRVVEGVSEAVKMFGGNLVPSPPGSPPTTRDTHALVGHLYYIDAKRNTRCAVEIVDTMFDRVLAVGDLNFNGVATETVFALQAGLWSIMLKVGFIDGGAVQSLVGAPNRGNLFGNGMGSTVTSNVLGVRVKTITLNSTGSNFNGTLVFDPDTPMGITGVTRGSKYTRTGIRQLVAGQLMPLGDIVQIYFDAVPEGTSNNLLKLSLVNVNNPQLNSGGQLVPRPPDKPYTQSMQGARLSDYGCCSLSIQIPRTQRFGVEQLHLTTTDNYSQMPYQQVNSTNYGSNGYGMLYSSVNDGMGSLPGCSAVVDLEWFWLDATYPEGPLSGTDISRIEVLDVNCNSVNTATTEVCVSIVAQNATADWRTPYSGFPHVSNATFVDQVTQQGPIGFFGSREGQRSKFQISLLGRGVQEERTNLNQWSYNSYPQALHVAGAEVFNDNLVKGLNNLPLLDARGFQMGVLRIRHERFSSHVPFNSRVRDLSEMNFRNLESRLFGTIFSSTAIAPYENKSLQSLQGTVVDVTIFGPMGHKFSTRMMPNETFQVLREHLARHLGISEELQELAFVTSATPLNFQFSGSPPHQSGQFPLDWNMTAPAALMAAQSIGAYTGSLLGSSPGPIRGRNEDPVGLTLQLGCTDRNKFFLAVKLPSGDEKPLCVDSFTTIGALKHAVALLMSTPKQRARMAAIGLSNARGRRVGTSDDTVLPDQIRLMANFQELQGDQNAIGNYGLVGGSVVIASTTFSGAPSSQSRLRRTQSAGVVGGRITIKLLGPDGGLGNVVQASQDDEVAILRSVLVSTRKYKGIGQQYLECYVDGNLVVDDSVSLVEAGCRQNSLVQYCYQGQSPQRGDTSSNNVSLTESVTYQNQSIVIDVEDSQGNIQQVTVPKDIPVSAVRRYAKSGDPNFSSLQRSFPAEDFVFLNGRLIHDEYQSIENAIRNSTGGTHFEVRPPKGRSSIVQADQTAVDEQRRRETETLTRQIEMMQDQLNRTVVSSRDQERRLATHVYDTEEQLQEERRRSQAARERVEELERALDRQQDLLRRAAAATTPYHRTGVALNPQVLEALARVNSPALRRY